MSLLVFAMAALLGAAVGVFLAQVGPRKHKRPEWGSDRWQVAQLEEMYRMETPERR